MKASLRWRGSIKAGSIGLRSEWLVWVERFDNFRMDYIDFCNLIGGERYSDRLTSSTPHWANKMGLQNLNRVKVRPLWANGIWPNGWMIFGQTGEWILAKRVNAKRKSISLQRNSNKTFMMVLVGVGMYAYRREDGVFVVPIGCLKD